MSEAYSIVALKAAITETADKLFSEGTLADKIALSLSLSAMKGLDLFSTTAPWYIDIPQQEPIAGFSETLRDAARDIHAQLVTLERTVSTNTSMTIGIDEARLFHHKQTILPLRNVVSGQK